MSKTSETIETQLLVLTRQFLLEQETTRALRTISVSASLERQLGIDSLGRVELMHRVEKYFGVRFSNEVIAEIDSIADLAKAIIKAKPDQKFKTDHIQTPQQSFEINLSRVKSLQETLIQYALYDPERPHIHLRDENGNEEIITCGKLLANASRIANGLIAAGIKPNDTVSLMLPTGADFFISFFGILLAGAIPVPIYPPFRASRIEEYATREAKILANAEVRCLITFSQAENLSKVLKSQIESLKLVTTASQLLSSKTSLPAIPHDENNIGLIQYTSGSTGDPKGVFLLNKNILANIRSVGKALNLNSSDAVVSWLPLYHDMGLMSWLGSLYFGIPFTILSPLTFLNRPEQWLWALHYHRATVSASPNFGYELCVKKIDDLELSGLDLSAWRLALNGAEAINPKTMEAFYKKFKLHGLNKTSLFPVYGLAENTVGLTLPKLNSVYRVDRVSKQLFETGLYAAEAKKNEDFLEFVSEGFVIPDHEIRVVDDTDTALPDRKIGSIQFRGPSAMQGYYRKPETTAKTYHQGWWDTGDLGYMVDKELFVTGRKKDLIIKAGRNLYPETFETIVGAMPGIRQGCVITFGITDTKLGTEKIIIVAEIRSRSEIDNENLQQEIIEQVTDAVGVPPDEILLVKPHTIPKTSSGKLQRAACKQAYIDKTLVTKQRSFRWQLATLFFQTMQRGMKNVFFKLLKIAYSFWVYLILITTFIPVWPAIMMTSQTMSAKIIKLWARLIFILVFCKIRVEYESSFRRHKKVIFAVNHASYVDAIVLLATLPEHTIFIGKKELLKVPVLSGILKKLKFIPVDRWDFNQNIEDVKKIKKVLKENQSIAMFPEGTFTWASGLRPFKSGAFQLAIDTHTPVVPVAIRGARHLLRANSIIFNPTDIVVTFCESPGTSQKDWNAVNYLRIATQKKIAAHCGEPLIDIIHTESGSD